MKWASWVQSNTSALLVSGAGYVTALSLTASGANTACAGELFNGKDTGGQPMVQFNMLAGVASPIVTGYDRMGLPFDAGLYWNDSSGKCLLSITAHFCDSPAEWQELLALLSP